MAAFFQSGRMMAIVERDLRKFFRSPALMVAAMVFPLVQLIVLGNAFGGKIRDAKLLDASRDLWIAHALLADAREIALHIRRKYRNADAAEGLGHDLQRNRLAGSSGSGNKSVTIG